MNFKFFIEIVKRKMKKLIKKSKMRKFYFKQKKALFYFILFKIGVQFSAANTKLQFFITIECDND